MMLFYLIDWFDWLDSFDSLIYLFDLLIWFIDWLIVIISMPQMLSFELNLYWTWNILWKRSRCMDREYWKSAKGSRMEEKEEKYD